MPPTETDARIDDIVAQMQGLLSQPTPTIPQPAPLHPAQQIAAAFLGGLDPQQFGPQIERLYAPFQPAAQQARVAAQAELDQRQQARNLQVLGQLASLAESQAQGRRAEEAGERAERGLGLEERRVALAEETAERQKAEAVAQKAEEEKREKDLLTLMATRAEALQSEASALHSQLSAIPGTPSQTVRGRLVGGSVAIDKILGDLESGKVEDRAAVVSLLQDTIKALEVDLGAAQQFGVKAATQGRPLPAAVATRLQNNLTAATQARDVYNEFIASGQPGGAGSLFMDVAFTDAQSKFRTRLQQVTGPLRLAISGSAVSPAEIELNNAFIPTGIGGFDRTKVNGLLAIRDNMLRNFEDTIAVFATQGYNVQELRNLAVERGLLSAASGVEAAPPPGWNYSGLDIPEGQQ